MIGPGRARSAHIVEVFSSIQGEGPHVGRRHLFIRLFACNIRCNYCDTPESLTGHPPARIEQTPGQGDFQILDNPLPLGNLLASIHHLAATPHHAAAITGGEPLLQAPFLRNLLPGIRSTGLPVYLETNGTLPEALADVIHLTDVVSMDLKLPQTLPNQRNWLPEHRGFIQIASQKEVFVKLVLPAAADLGWIREAAQMVASIDSRIPFIIQPLTPQPGSPDPPSQSDVLAALDAISPFLPDVRVIPQMHKLMGVR